MFIINSCLCFVLLVLASMPLNAENMRFLALGDSLTAGYRVASTSSYPSQLERLMKKRGKNVTIVNAGVSGDTSADILRRIDWSLKAGPFEVVLLCVGANDGLRGLSNEKMEHNIRQIIQKFKGQKSKIILLGMKMPTQVGVKSRTEFEAVYKKIAKEQKLIFYEFLLEGVVNDPSLNLGDQIHPNEKGYEVIAMKLDKFLKAQGY